MKMAWRLIKMARQHWGVLSVAALALIGAAVMGLVTPGIVQKLTALLESNAATGGELASLCLILVGAYALRMVCRFGAMYLSHLGAWSFVADLTFQIYDKLQTLSQRYFSDKQTGELLSRTVNDSRQIEVLVAHALPDLVSSLLIVLGVAVMLFIINPVLTLLTLLPVPLILFVFTRFSRKVAPLFRVNQVVWGEINGVLQDNLSGMKEIQAFGKEGWEHDKLDAYRRKYAQVNIRANKANGLFHPSVEFLTSLGTVVVVGLGGYMAMGGAMDISEVVGFLMYLSLFYQPLTTLARLVEDVQVSFAGAVRVFEILDAQSEIVEKPGAIELGHTDGSVEFRHVSFQARPGEMIALVGPTGVGKTTIVSLMERFYDVEKGAITIGGYDVRDVTLSSLRRQMSLVLQDVFLFNGTIAENIAYGVNRATREEIVAAAKAACADEFIMAMPEGYDTVVGERGTRLSGGQKQRLAIARAILRDAPILVLDEATSAVDNRTEREIQRAIEGLAGTRTMIVIAHRLTTIQRADQILVLDKGRVVERGTHAELLAQGGIYQKMAQGLE